MKQNQILLNIWYSAWIIVFLKENFQLTSTDNPIVERNKEVSKQVILT